MRFFRSAVLMSVAWLLLVGVCFGKQVYFKDGSVLECQSFRRNGDEITVQVNRDVVLTFEKKEIDVKRTFPKVVKKEKRTPSKGHASAVKAAAVSGAEPPATAAPAEPHAPAAATVPKLVTPPTPPPAPATKSTVQPDPPQPPPAPSASPELERLQKEMESQKNAPPPKVPVNPATLSTALLLLVVCIVIGLASMWVVFVKAGESGVASIIPIYNMFVLMEISGRPWWWLILWFIPVVGIIVGVLTMISLAERFGKGLLFGVGLAFLPMIFFPLLAFGGAQYEGTTRRSHSDMGLVTEE